MKSKEAFFNSDIIQDLRRLAGTSKKTDKSTYTKITVCAVAVGIPAGILAVLFPWEAALALLGMTALLILAVPAQFFWKRYKQKNVSMDDYEIMEDTLSHKEEEVHKETRHATRHHRRTVTVVVYRLHFENGKSLQIPGDNFPWSEEQSMSDASLYNEAHRGDGFYLVVHKESGKIAAVYPKSRFVYQER